MGFSPPRGEGASSLARWAVKRISGPASRASTVPEPSVTSMGNFSVADLRLGCFAFMRESVRNPSSQAKPFHELPVKHGGEGTNRTYLDPLDEPTAVLKTAGATRHPSLSFAVIYDLRFAIYEAENEAGELDLPNRKS